MIARLTLLARLIEERARYRMALEAIRLVTASQYSDELKRQLASRIALRALHGSAGDGES